MRNWNWDYWLRKEAFENMHSCNVQYDKPCAATHTTSLSGWAGQAVSCQLSAAITAPGNSLASQYWLPCCYPQTFTLKPRQQREQWGHQSRRCRYPLWRLCWGTQTFWSWYSISSLLTLSRLPGLSAGRYETADCYRDLNSSVCFQCLEVRDREGQVVEVGETESQQLQPGGIDGEHAGGVSPGDQDQWRAHSRQQNTSSGWGAPGPWLWSLASPPETQV